MKAVQRRERRDPITFSDARRPKDQRKCATPGTLYSMAYNRSDDPVCLVHLRTCATYDAGGGNRKKVPFVVVAYVAFVVDVDADRLSKFG